MQYLAIGVNCLIGTIFLVSAFGKLARRGSLAAFTESVRGMRAVPSNMTRKLAVSIVAVEVAVCVLLANPLREARAIGLVSAAVMLAVFAVAVASAVHRGVREPCRCFGRSSTPMSYWQAGRNLVLALVAAIGAAALLSGRAADTAQFGAATIAVLGGVLTGCLVVFADHIVELFQPIEKVPGAAVGAR
ncbi:hypothetical protein NDR87_03630 [Nocardia sp. CDC159]|uniref:Methylamine utilisation protein MauE domain-containing protein n=1 Tax=Nocardia pulmonis TaxID=2951408 RepID=A0A9X2IUB8_9NOCA|nr:MULTISPECIES: MauE/DoxX family redox-associated membrane protein [Nocardia]MCM6771893.1 hypothetical protein [Nocardia pulmonis]MCM6785449.1 hypothetical protein [Nocardia sp. CDC159]